MKNLRLLGFLMILASSSLLINCTSDPIQGPPGADGSDGIDGIDGVDSTTDCRTCHSNAYREPIEAGYAISTHAIGGHVFGETVTEGRNRYACARCHSNEGFMDQIDYGSTEEEGYKLVTPISCTGCHFEHRSFNFEEDDNDFAIRTLEPVTLIVDSLITIDLTNESNALGQSNLCVNCHQPRQAMPNDDGTDELYIAETDEYEIDNTHWGTHHNPQSTMLEGIQGVQFEGTKIYPDPRSSTHRQESSCVNCHMRESSVATTGDHTFNPRLDACIDCHGELENFNVDGFQTEVDAQLEVLAGLLAQVEGKNAAGETITGIVVDDDPVAGIFPFLGAQAAWNYIFVSEDQSRGVHNPEMVEALLQNTIEALQNQ